MNNKLFHGQYFTILSTTTNNNKQLEATIQQNGGILMDCSTWKKKSMMIIPIVNSSSDSQQKQKEEEQDGWKQLSHVVLTQSAIDQLSKSSNEVHDKDQETLLYRFQQCYVIHMHHNVQFISEMALQESISHNQPLSSIQSMDKRVLLNWLPFNRSSNNSDKRVSCVIKVHGMSTNVNSEIWSEQLERIQFLCWFLGAEYSEELTTDCTHIIVDSSSRLTKQKQDVVDKMIQHALKKSDRNGGDEKKEEWYLGVKIMSFEWLNECAKRSNHVNEDAFIVVTQKTPFVTLLSDTQSNVPMGSTSTAQPTLRVKESTAAATTTTVTPTTPAIPSKQITFSPAKKGREESKKEEEPQQHSISTNVKSVATDSQIIEQTRRLRAIFQKFTFYVCRNQYSADIQADLIEVLKDCGAKISNQYQEACTHVLARFQDVEVCETALKQNKKLVTAQWLDDCIQKRQLMDYNEQLIYTPLASRVPIPELRDWTMSVSSLSGSLRSDIIYLIQCTGAQFSGALHYTYSCLIMPDSEAESVREAVRSKTAQSKVTSKQDLAIASKIPIVSDRWIRQCVQEWRYVPIDTYVLSPDQEYELPKCMSEERATKPEQNKTQAKRGREKKEEENEEEEEPQTKRSRVTRLSSRKQEEDAMEDEDEEDENEDEEDYSEDSEQQPIILLSSEIPKAKTYNDVFAKLGAKVLTSVSDDEPMFTHLISGSLKRTEKVLCACASGAWVLKASYLADSIKANRLLDEEEYEYDNQSNIGSSGRPTPNPKEWRQHITSTNRLPFENEKIILIQSNESPPIGVLKKVLMVGGASVVQRSFVGSRPRVPQLKKEELEDVSYAIVDPEPDHKTEKLIAQLKQHKIKMVRGDYVLDRITQSPSCKPNIKEYEIN